MSIPKRWYGVTPKSYRNAINGNMTEGNHSFLYPTALAAWIGPKHPCKLSESWKYLIDQISIYIHWDLALVNTLERRQMALGEGMRMIVGKWSRDQMPRNILTLCVACPLGNLTPLRHIAATAPLNSVKTPRRQQDAQSLLRDAERSAVTSGADTKHVQARQARVTVEGKRRRAEWLGWQIWQAILPVLWSLDKHGYARDFISFSCLVPWTKSGDERVKVPKWFLRDFQVWEAWNFTHLLFHGRCVTSVYDQVSQGLVN